MFDSVDASSRRRNKWIYLAGGAFGVVLMICMIVLLARRPAPVTIPAPAQTNGGGPAPTNPAVTFAANQAWCAQRNGGQTWTMNKFVLPDMIPPGNRARQGRFVLYNATLLTMVPQTQQQQHDSQHNTQAGSQSGSESEDSGSGSGSGSGSESGGNSGRRTGGTSATKIGVGKMGYVQDGYLVIENGKIVSVGTQPGGGYPPAVAPPGSEMHNALGRWVTPGIVDIHNHIGVWAWPQFPSENDDSGEDSNPISPQMRAVDGFHMDDWSFDTVIGGGVTTANVLPGSGNVMGGEGVTIKLVSGRPARLSQILVEDAPRFVKMACGQNPRSYGEDKGEIPYTRMGIAWLARQAFGKARQQILVEDAFCHKLSASSPSYTTVQDNSIEPIVGILRGQVGAHIHCYQDFDLEDMLRVSDEFGYNITAFHHAGEAFLMADTLRQRNIHVATHAEIWLSKLETYNNSVWGAWYLYNNGTSYSMISDHSVTNAHELFVEAAKTTLYNVPHWAALASITSQPAQGAKLDYRVGSLASGKDADFVIWQDYPLKIGSTPAEVYVEGNPQTFTQDPYVPAIDSLTSWLGIPAPVLPPSGPNEDLPTAPATPPTFAPNCSALGKNEWVSLLQASAAANGALYIYNATIFHLQSNDTTYQNNALKASDITVENGVITCLGICAAPAGALTLNGAGLVITPGLIAAESIIGQYDNGRETSDTLGSIDVPPASAGLVRTTDGIVLLSAERQQALAGGITTVVVRPTGRAQITGVSGAFDLHGTILTDGTEGLGDANIVKKDVGIAVNMDYDAKQSSGLAAALSGQITALRQALEAANATANSTSTVDGEGNVLAKVMRGDAALYVNAHTADIIAANIRLLKRDLGVPRVVIVGGSEAWVVAPLLAKYNVPVILNPARCFVKRTWKERRCRNDGIVLLTQAGVQVGLAAQAAAWAHNARFDAGIAAARGVPVVTALKAVTRTLGELYGLEDGVGKPRGSLWVGSKANFVVHAGNPMTFNTRVLMVVSGNNYVCEPIQL